MARRRGLQFNRRRKSGRAFVLLAILFLFTLTIAPPIKHYFTQRAQIQALKAQVSSDRQALQDARAQLEQWKDPDYIKSQARERLHFVLPGERQYIVTTNDEETSQESGLQIAESVPLDQPWYTRIIASISESGLK